MGALRMDDGSIARRAKTAEEKALLRRASGAFVQSVEALTRSRGIRPAELALLLHDDDDEAVELDDPVLVRARTREWGNYRNGARGMSFGRLLRAMQRAASRYGWRDDAGVGELLDQIARVDHAELHAIAVAHEKDVERATAAALLDAAQVLVQQFGWPLSRVTRMLSYEMQERMQDVAEADAAFREWYREWRKENPTTE